MKAKTILTIALLLFIFASVAYLVVEEVRSGSPPSPSAEMNQPAVEEPNELSSVPTASKVVVYYFHGTARCLTCRKFESFSIEALQQAFAEAINDGRLEWRVVNVERPGNEHFIKDYQLYSKSLVIAKIQNGRQTAWKNLTRIWELVRDKRVFMRYIQEEVGGYMGAD